jgi:serine/threonine-protein kinase
LYAGRYLIQRKLGSGAVGDVYLARDRELEHDVALELLDGEHANDARFVERYRKAVLSAAGLRHPNIVRIFGRGSADGTDYVAMELVAGRRLDDLLAQGGVAPIRAAVDYVEQILAALAFAHRAELVHRGIKPHVIFVGDDGVVKVADFGLGALSVSPSSARRDARYLSPEQVLGRPVGPQSDLYSLGIVSYELLTGTTPITGRTAVEIAAKHSLSDVAPPSQLRKEVPASLDAVVMRALAKAPDDRYESAEAMKAALRRRIARPREPGRLLFEAPEPRRSRPRLEAPVRVRRGRQVRTPAYDLFVSHADADKAFADSLVKGLDRAGRRCWIAHRDVPAGADYGAAIVKAIQASRMVALVFSAAAARSGHVLRELDLAIDHQKRIVPIKIDQAVPTDGLAYRLATVQWVSASGARVSKALVKELVGLLPPLSV